jgi:hypothetical protein
MSKVNVRLSALKQIMSSTKDHNLWAKCAVEVGLIENNIRENGPYTV